MIVKRKNITHIRPFLNISESFEQEYELAVGVYHLEKIKIIYIKLYISKSYILSINGNTK